MATIKAYMTPLRRRADADEEFLTGRSYAPPAVTPLLGGNRSSSGALTYTAPVNSGAGSLLYPQRTSQVSGLFGRGVQGVLGGYTPPSSGAAKKPAKTPAADGTETPAAGSGTTSGIESSAQTATELPNNNYHYADMYGDANTLMAYKALPEYLSAQGLRNQGMSESAWLAIRGAYQPPQPSAGGGTGGGTDVMSAIRRGSGKDRSWLQQYSDIDYDYSAPEAVTPSVGGTPSYTPPSTSSYASGVVGNGDYFLPGGADNPHASTIYQNGFYFSRNDYQDALKIMTDATNAGQSPTLALEKAGYDVDKYGNVQKKSR